MANRFANPNDVFYDASGNVANGGTLQFYASGTTTPLSTYSNQGLTIANTNPVTLDSSGKVPSNIDIFLQNLAYSVVFKDSLGNTVWTKDPVFASDFSTIAQFTSYNGNPNGAVAGTAGSATIAASSVWDFTNKILYVCTQTGNSAAAVWTAINASTAAAVVPAPQGYLTLTLGTPIISVDTTTTTFFYTPYVGNIVPIYNGSSFTPTIFSELSYGMTSNLSANLLYDVFVFNYFGVPTLVTGPAWSVSTAGAGTRGTGAGTTQLQRISGLWVNAVQITGLNGATNYTVPANQATYLGTIAMDSVAGTVTCHVSYGQTRKWGVWNAYNRISIKLIGGDPTANWAYSTATIRATNNNSANKMTTLCGLPEERILASQLAQASTTSVATATVGLGLNSTTAFSGTPSASGLGTTTGIITMFGQLMIPPGIGINNIQALENANGGASVVFYGTQTTMNYMAQWNG